MMARRGFDDLKGRVHATWLASAELALAEYPVTVGAIPISEALRPGGLLVQLAAAAALHQIPEVGGT